MARRQGAIQGHPGPADRRSLKLNSPLVVQWEYASEERLAKRSESYRQLVEGAHAEDVAFAAVAEEEPRRVLDAGCGTGEFVERIARELGAKVLGLDLSARMAALTAARGIETRVGDVQALPFENGEFDVAVAAWMRCHVADLDRGLAELARALRPAGRLVAVTNSNGEALLRRHFARVERREVRGTVTFPYWQAAHRYVAASASQAHLAAELPPFDGAFRASRHVTVFVAETAA